MGPACILFSMCFFPVLKKGLIDLDLQYLRNTQVGAKLSVAIVVFRVQCCTFSSIVYRNIIKSNPKTPQNIIWFLVTISSTLRDKAGIDWTWPSRSFGTYTKLINASQEELVCTIICHLLYLESPKLYRICIFGRFGGAIENKIVRPESSSLFRTLKMGLSDYL